MEYINNNEINDNEINIRVPDQPIRQRLIEDNLINDDDDDDDELERAIMESMNEYRLQHHYEFDEFDDFNQVNIIEEDNNDIVEEMKNEITSILPIFKTKIMRLINFDKQLKELWEKISPIIELYECEQIIHHIVDEETYNTMFHTLKTIRIPKDEQALLETIFIKQLN
jgi:hypothetical protein